MAVNEQKINRIIDALQREFTGETVDDVLIVLAAITASSIQTFAVFTEVDPLDLAKEFLTRFSDAVIITSTADKTMQ